MALHLDCLASHAGALDIRFGLGVLKRHQWATRYGCMYPDVQSLATTDLFRLYGDVLNELRARKITRSTNNPRTSWPSCGATRLLGAGRPLSMSTTGSVAHRLAERLWMPFCGTLGDDALASSCAGAWTASGAISGIW